MTASIEVLGISVGGKVVRRYDDANDRTTVAVTQAQARELYDALGPVIKFFDELSDADDH